MFADTWIFIKKIKWLKINISKKKIQIKSAKKNKKQSSTRKRAKPSPGSEDSYKSSDETMILEPEDGKNTDKVEKDKSKVKRILPTRKTKKKPKIKTKSSTQVKSLTTWVTFA